MDSSIQNTPVLPGIDTLYYFTESNDRYISFYEKTVSQVESRKMEMELYGVKFKPQDAVIDIKGHILTFNGIGKDGFYWFQHPYFRVGIKDVDKNPNLHNIAIQFDAVGIYDLGLRSLYEFVQKTILKEITTNKNYITRMDVNAFVNHDFSYITKEMIVTRKQYYEEIIRTVGSVKKLQTIYIGKKPFLCRIYDKSAELAKTEKESLMLNYLSKNGIDIAQTVFNVEFQLNRDYLKRFKIDTVEDALSRAEALFKSCMEDIRLIDTESITENKRNSKNRYEGKTLPVWDHIKEQYTVSVLMQITTPLEKVKKVTGRYSMYKAAKQIRVILNRLLIRNITPTMKFLEECLEESKAYIENRGKLIQFYEMHELERMKRLDVNEMENGQIMHHLASLEKEMYEYSEEPLAKKELMQRYLEVWEGAVNRGLIRAEDIPF